MDLFDQLGLPFTSLFFCLAGLAVGVTVDKARMILRLWRRPARAIGEVIASTEADQVEAARRGCTGDDPFFPVARAVLEDFGRDRAALTRKAEEAGASELERLERRLPLLSVVAGISPLVGLLGTVIGMIGTMGAMSRSMAEAGTPDLVSMSAGISQALLTTAVGLGIAIPAFLAYWLLRLAIDRLVADVERDTGRLLDAAQGALELRALRRVS